MKSKNFNFKKLAAVSCFGLLTSLNSSYASAQTETRIVFNGFNGSISTAWNQTEPVFESGISYEGSGSAQIDSGGSMVRTFNVDQNTDYRVSVMIRGGGRIRVRWDGNNLSRRVTSPSSSWVERDLEFNSGSATSIDVSLEFESETGRFDAVRIFEVASSTSSSSSSSSTSSGIIYNMRKRNQQFSIDGAGGAQQGIQVYLWNTSLTNVNQQWVELDRGNGFFAYQKRDTSLCLDGGNGGARLQPIILNTCSANNQNQHWQKIDQAEGHTRLKKRGVSFSIDGNRGAARRQEIYLWNSGDSNVDQHWEFTSVGMTDTSSSSGTSSTSSGSTTASSTSSTYSSSSSGDFGLNPNLEPWENFDLADWALDAPNADPSDGLSARTNDTDFIAGRLFPGSEPYFFTGSDGAMVFRSNVGGARTSSNTSFPRSELREMLRRGADGVSTIGVNENNWVLGYQPNNLDLGAHTSGAQDNTPTRVGGRNGVLRVTMRVNRVTTTGSGTHPGRTIIGQIHADNDEPLRLYYRKLPGNTNGSIYFSHEIRDGDDIDDVNLIGSESSSQSNPSNGIALGELFSYEIINEGAVVEAIIRRGDRDGPIIAQGSVNMDDENSGYDRDDEWMYFKAGAYTQNNTGNDSDFDEVAIYRLENTHD